MKSWFSNSNLSLQFYHTPKPYINRNLVNLIAQKEDILYRTLQIMPDRLQYCKKVNEDLLGVINRRKPQILAELANMCYGDSDVAHRSTHYNPSRYRDLNLHATFTKGTIDFRLRQGVGGIGFPQFVHRPHWNAYVTTYFADCSVKLMDIYALISLHE